jgi:hypothetical protein
MRGGLVLLIGAVLLMDLADARRRPLAQGLDPDCDIRTSERVVAVGDIHGAHDSFLAILRAAGVIDRRDRWAGGRTIFIQTGDVLDRGDHSRKTLDLLRRLEREARSAGGRVIALVGNHEVMRLAGDWRYVSAGEYAAFRNADSIELRDNAREQMAAAAAARARAEKQPFDAARFRDEFFRDVPIGFIEMRLAFAPAGDYGRWLRERRAIVKVNGVLFLHGGISDEVAALGCAAINETVAREMRSMPGAAEQLASLLSTRETGPLWYRGLATDPEETFGPTLESILQRMGARAIVIGHTPVVGRIATRFGGRVLQIDSGMLDGTFYPGGVPAALEMRGESFTGVYLDRREPLPVPALAGSR